MYPLLLRTYNTTLSEVKPCPVYTPKGEEDIFMLKFDGEEENIVKNGDYAGKFLSRALSLAGETEEENLRFPLSIRLINTTERLPVKVYPDDEFAAKSGEKGKTTLLYIADCKENAEMVYGLSRNVSKGELINRIRGGSLSAVCNFVSVEKGDVFFIPAGIVFAIGAGICAFEISTEGAEYIISDYGKKSADGQQKPIGPDRAAEVVKPEKINIRYGNTGDMTLYPFGTVRELCDCAAFKTDLIAMDGNMGFYDNESPVSIIIVSGEIDMSYPSGTMRLRAGKSVAVPAGIKVRLSGKAEILCTKIKD